MNYRLFITLIFFAIFIQGVLQKARAEFAIIDGKLLMPMAVITNTKTTMTHKASKVKFVFEQETSIFHEEDKTIVRPEVKECGNKVAEHFFDNIFNNNIHRLVRKLEEKYPAASLQLTINYKTFQHEGFFTSSFGVTNLVISKGPKGDSTKAYDYSKDLTSPVFDSRTDHLCPEGNYSLPLKWLEQLGSEF